MSELAKSLVKAQKAFRPVLKQSINPHFRSRYADLASVIDAVVDSLNDNGIFLTQVTHPSASEKKVIVETIFIHESGEERSMGKIEIPVVKEDPQAFGSAITYARRYSLLAACGIAQEDDDGNAASNYSLQARVASSFVQQQTQQQRQVSEIVTTQEAKKDTKKLINHAQPIVEKTLQIAKQANDLKAVESKWKEKIEQAKQEALEISRGNYGKS